jgi:hypothetical protein
MWCAFENGQSLGKRGSEGGVIVLDEEHAWGARITLERDGGTAAWSIACGIYGTFRHTAFASSESEGRSKYSDMKRDLVSIMEEGSSTPCYEKMRLFADVY